MGARAAVRDRALTRAWAVSLGLLALAGLAAWQSSEAIGRYFPDRPLPGDLLLEILPYARAAQYVADTTVALAMIMVLVHYARVRPRDIPAAVTPFSVMYLLRAGINLLTPLASPHGEELFGWFPSQNGMFPSGHSGNVLLCVLLVDRTKYPRLWTAALAIAVVEWTTLLVSRGHYSIDIVGGLLLAYFVHAEWERGASWLSGLKRLVTLAR